MTIQTVLNGRARPIIFSVMLAVSVGGLSGALQANSEGNDEAREAFAKAQEYRARGNTRAARIELMNAIKADPNWIEARIFQAETLLNLSDGIGAQSELNDAIKMGSELKRTRHLYGHALMLQGKFKDAKVELLANDIPVENQAYAARILGRVGTKMGDDGLASQAFDHAIKLDPKYPELWVDIARFRAGSGDQAGAIAAVDEAVKLDPQNVSALQYRGELIRFQFGLGAALPWFERALQIDPNDVDLLTEYAATLGDMGRMKDMLVITRKVIALDAKNPRAYFMQSVLAARAGKYKLARMLMQKTGGRIDDVAAVMLVQGIIEHSDGNFNVAVDKFRRLNAIQPNNQQAQILLARSLYLSGDAEESVHVLKSQVNRSGAEPYALWQVGRALEALGKREEAVGVFNRVALHDVGKEAAFPTNTQLNVLAAEAKRSPNDARIVVPYINALYDVGQYDEAFWHAKRLQNGNMGASAAHILVADTAFARGDYDEALNALGQAQKIHFSEPVMLRSVQALRAKGAMQQSGELLAQYLRHNPSNVAGLRWIAYSHLEVENWAVAAKILENLRKRIGENDALIMAGLAQAYTGLGETEKAVEAGRIAYHVQPSSPVVSHLYGLAILAGGNRDRDAIQLIEKAVRIAPKNVTYQQSLMRAYATFETNRKNTLS